MSFKLRGKKQSDDWSAGGSPARLPQAIEKVLVTFKIEVIKMFIRVPHHFGSLRLLHAQAGKVTRAPVVKLFNFLTSLVNGNKSWHQCFFIACVLLLLLIVISCSRSSSISTQPKLILWAWERPENFSFIPNKDIGVAFLAQTIELKNNDVTKILRRQPIEIPDGTFVIAVTRIESDKKEKPTLSQEQLKETVDTIAKTSALKNVKVVQIDFDALESEREFYKSMLADLRKQLPQQTKLSITALASWCIHDNWIKDAPIDEAVPMLFRMGVDEQKIVSYLNSNNDWREPLCRQSYGITLDEPARKVEATRRLYVFNPRSWTKEDLEKINDKVTR